MVFNNSPHCTFLCVLKSHQVCGCLPLSGCPVGGLCVGSGRKSSQDTYQNHLSAQICESLSTDESVCAIVRHMKLINMQTKPGQARQDQARTRRELKGEKGKGTLGIQNLGSCWFCTWANPNPDFHGAFQHLEEGFCVGVENGTWLCVPLSCSVSGKID